MIWRRSVSVLFLWPFLLAQAATLSDLQSRAVRGDALAQGQLGWVYLTGKGVPKDVAVGINWLELGASQGNPNAEGALAWAYGHGLGVPKDFVHAAELWRKSADQGNAISQALLGVAYAKGLGVPKDESEAVALWTKAAAQRNPKGQTYLGMAYYRGIVVQQDRLHAKYLWRLAVKTGDQEARDFLNRAERADAEASARVSEEMTNAARYKASLDRDRQAVAGKLAEMVVCGLSQGKACAPNGSASAVQTISARQVCDNDIDCEFGNRCVRPRDSFGDGICVQPVDEFGIPTTGLAEPSVGPHEITGCNFDTDCDVGFRCRKEDGALEGLCIR